MQYVALNNGGRWRVSRYSQVNAQQLPAIVMLICTLWLVSGSVCIVMGKDMSIAGSDTRDDYLTPQQIATLEEKALAGDGKAAFRLANYWQNYEVNSKEAAYWLQIGAENGHLISQLNLSAYMQSIPSAFGVAKGDTKSLKRLGKRAKFWENKAQGQEKKNTHKSIHPRQ
ncbi:hypothetical protein ANAEL_00311 [Anaerolineales bacterium]|nr:hypothetical protein ANAEL_00311 [Anaerolineales bacterium]